MATAVAAKKKAVSPLKGTRVTGSAADQIDRLEVGASFATAERHEIDGMNGASVLMESLKKLRNGLGSYVVRITDELDSREFKVESGTYLTDDKTGVMVSAVVTRMA